jgi:hypothetical protein
MAQLRYRTPDSRKWQSLGAVYSAKTRSPLVEIVRIEGRSFESKEAAVRHGVELAKRWIDDHTPEVKPEHS